VADDGETVTYTYTDGTSDLESTSQVQEMIIEYIDGAGGESTTDASGGSGARVENVVVDISNESLVYLWVSGGTTEGRYEGGPGNAFSGYGAGSAEVSFSSDAQGDTPNADVLAGAGGGGGADDGDGGAREGSPGAFGQGDPFGGDGGGFGFSGQDGFAYVDTLRNVVIEDGNQIDGGGSGPETDGEIRITYSSQTNADTFSDGTVVTFVDGVIFTVTNGGNDLS